VKKAPKKPKKKVIYVEDSDDSESDIDEPVVRVKREPVAKVQRKPDVKVQREPEQNIDPMSYFI
jgi:hypothetical protein